jgi:hypothetical protein
MLILFVCSKLFTHHSSIFESLIIPCFRFLVGEGAYKWAKSKGMDLLESTSEANSVSPGFCVCVCVLSNPIVHS